jgi:tripartite-type tricarboxylate transporter receptor subunit TctC
MKNYSHKVKVFSGVNVVKVNRWSIHMTRKSTCWLKGFIGIQISFFVCMTGVAFAQDYPNRAVKIIVPFPPGGSAEQQARVLANALNELWGQPVIIENKPGAGATIGAAFVAKAPADGYTLYFASTSHTIAPALYKDLPYHAVKSFAPISMVSISPLILTVPPQMKVSNVKELIALAKANPGKLNYATSGTGGSPHLAGELFRSKVDIDVTHVPTKGSAPAMTAVIGGHVDYLIADMSALPLYRAGKLKPLAVTTITRSVLLPDVPTMAEEGLEGYQVANWGSILAPAGTPRAVVQTLNSAIRQVLNMPAVKDRYNKMGFDVQPTTPEELETRLTQEMIKYIEVVNKAGITNQ